MVFDGRTERFETSDKAGAFACGLDLGHAHEERVMAKVFSVFRELILFSREHAQNPIVTCEKCEGAGEQFGAHQEACHTCGGEGRVCQDLPSVQDVEDLSSALEAAEKALDALKGTK